MEIFDLHRAFTEIKKQRRKKNMWFWLILHLIFGNVVRRQKEDEILTKLVPHQHIIYFILPYGLGLMTASSAVTDPLKYKMCILNILQIIF